MPDDIRKKKLAGNLLIMAQSGQYNYSRCIKHGEVAAAQLAVFEFVKSAIQCVFVLNGVFAPYYKWQFKAMQHLPVLGDLGPFLEYLITTPNDGEYCEEKYFTIEDIASRIIDELQNREITNAICADLEKHAYSVNDSIQDPQIRNMHILAAVKE